MIILDILFFIIFISSLILFFFSLNIYELLSLSRIRDIAGELSEKFSFNQVLITLILSNSIIYNQTGNIVVNLTDNYIKFIIQGNQYTLDIDEDFAKIVPMYYRHKNSVNSNI